MTKYADGIYRAAQGRMPLPSLQALLAGSPTALGRGMHSLQGTEALRRLCHEAYAKVVGEQLHVVYGTRHRWEASPQLVMHGIDVGGAGIIHGPHGKILLDIAFDSCVGWDAAELPPVAATAALAKAWLQGLDYARVIYINQNSQDWSFWDLAVPDPDVPARVLERVREAAEAFEDAFAGGSQPDPRGVASFPLVADRLVADEGRAADVIKTLAVEEARQTRKGGVISPSEISITSCDRRVGYSLQRTERRDRFPVDLYRVFAYGTAIHNLVQGLLLDEYPNLVAETHVRNEALRISGSADLGDEDDNVCIEIKSMTTHQAKKLRTAKGEHQKQATIYARAGTRRYSGVTYLYVDKELYVVKELPTPADVSLWHQIAARAQRIVVKVAEGLLPDKTDDRSQCNNCPYLWTCRPEMDQSTESSILRFVRAGRTSRRTP